MDTNDLINKIIETQKNNIRKEVEFCCGRCSFNTPVNIIETDKVKIIYTDEGDCEIRRKKNDNPVICRNKENKIYRQHGEWHYIKHEMYILAGLTEEANELLTKFNNFD